MILIVHTSSVCPPVLEPSKSFLVPVWVNRYFPEANGLLDISPTKLDLFEISGELQFRVCYSTNPRSSPHTAWES